ncbi:MAG TPA: alkaline phosphatase family protein, partial [Patescibacteria group bacterium]
LCFVTMTDYGKDVTSIVAYEPQSIEATLASAVCAADMNQAHIAETEKYPHATYFLNGGKEDTHAKEEHVLIPSNKHVKTHDEAPEMKAKEICDAAIERLATNDFIFVNFANPDMVGHTAKKEAIITAVETVDRELGRLAEATLKANGAVIAIADHGNAERMIDPETGAPHTAHTTNLVPCILIADSHAHVSLAQGGGLKDIAPTVLDLLGIEKPASMTGASLITE